MFEIEKGKPLPGNHGRNGLAKYPWRDMDLGDSFFVPGITVNKLSSSAHAARKRTGFSFALRGENGGVRVWRTA